jgi:hypothetical protein
MEHSLDLSFTNFFNSTALSTVSALLLLFSLLLLLLLLLLPLCFQKNGFRPQLSQKRKGSFTTTSFRFLLPVGLVMTSKDLGGNSLQESEKYFTSPSLLFSSLSLSLSLSPYPSFLLSLSLPQPYQVFFDSSEGKGEDLRGTHCLSTRCGIRGRLEFLRTHRCFNARGEVLPGR